MPLLVLPAQLLLVEDADDEEGSEATGRQSHRDEDDPERGVEVVVVDMASEQVEDAPDDQRESNQTEPEGLADNLADRHVASIPACSACLASHRRLRDRT